MNNDIQITLTEAEAWVLFEFTRRFSETDKISIEDTSEEQALWNLCCTFEKSLSFNKDIEFTEFMKQCKNKLKNNE